MGTTSRICVGVVDGNTFITNKRVRIGLARVSPPPINTPEGRIAKELLESLILGQFITYDRVAIGARRREVEAVAEVWLDDKNVNDAMRAAGYQEASAQMQPGVCGTETGEQTTKAWGLVDSGAPQTNPTQLVEKTEAVCLLSRSDQLPIPNEDNG
jgi:hypothetical protein